MLEQKLTGREIGYGSNVAIAGTRLLVEGNGVHVYDWDGKTWNHAGQVTDPRESQPKKDEARGFSLFGSKLALSGDTLLVGAPHANDAAGEAYAFKWSSAERRSTRTERLAKDNAGERPTPNSFVASSLAVSSDFIVLGSFDTAYVFARSGQEWRFSEKLFPKDAAPGRRFGTELALGQKRLLVSDPWKDRTGRVYVFELDDAGRWVERGQMNGSESVLFGSEIALSGDLAAASAQRCSSSSNDARCVFVFERDKSGGWNAIQKLSPADSKPRYFGSSVAISGDLIVVGAIGKSPMTARGPDIGKRLDPGAVYIFQRDASGRYAQRAVLSGSELGELEFASDVSVSGERMVVGAPAPTPDFDEEIGDTPDDLEKHFEKLAKMQESEGSVYVYAFRPKK